MNADHFGYEQVVIQRVSSYFGESKKEQTKFTRMRVTRRSRNGRRAPSLSPAEIRDCSQSCSS